ncbi:NAD-dependent succinate-semialdehyde dehydrogenase [uncultured Caulobacter sp.]|uniref:NAD-dependent succinate-semialdehyde dehydrogenase n=1 Tax=uncultured Caulobacter sp. TaxID=158749 RepID=UPI002633A8ED|nr:NAD-dependent succinate-semialdehyde dehydrogenase [uncultured Caulobacter sp.]
MLAGQTIADPPSFLARPDLFRQAAFIDGAWVEAEARLAVRNPANNAVIGVTPNLGAAETILAVEAAERAFQSWRKLTGKARGAILRRWFDLIIANSDDLAGLLTLEQGKPLAEARGEIQYAASFIEWFAEEAKRIYGETIPGHEPGRRQMVIKQPVGVVAAVTPWNFPAAMITRKVAPALAVGCTVVLKPSELTPFTALALAFLAREAGLPAGAFNIVTGEAPPIGDVLTTDPRIKKFTFTGSTPVGKMLAAKCMATVKRVSLELGGNAPLIVFDDADLDKAVEGAISSKFRNTGQTCVCANRLLVQAGIHDAFAAKLTARVAGFVVGDGLQGPTDQGPLINEAAVAKVRGHVEDAKHGGARVLIGGESLEGAGHFFAPTVLVDVTPRMRMSREETFGPVAGLIRFETEEEAVSIANATSAGLAAYFFTRDVNRAWRVGEALEAGMVGINTGQVSSETAPFGGVKESGLGREGAHYGADEFVELKLLSSDIND